MATRGKPMGIVAVVGALVLAIVLAAVLTAPAAPTAVAEPPTPRITIYNGDEIRPILPLSENWPVAEPVPYGTDVEGVYFDGYPQIVKEEVSQPMYGVVVEKDVMVEMRDGVHLAVDIYRPDAEGQFPAILSYAFWGKELQEITRWLPEQQYYDTPFWDGCIEAGAIDYYVERGYVRVIPEPRATGNSEGDTRGTWTDKYDTIEWIAEQEWCDGNVGMLGACIYAGEQLWTAQEETPEALKCIVPWENIAGTGDYFHGIFDCMMMSIGTARHSNDSLAPGSRLPATIPDFPEAWIEEALNDPDIKYNGRWYSIIRYPWTSPSVYSGLISSLHPTPGWPSRLGNVIIPTYMSTPWNENLYTHQTFEAWDAISTPLPNKKLFLWPSKAPGRPFVAYSDEALRWFDYWLKGIDTGILDEPPIKMFVMGENKWRFENEWPLERTVWTEFYLQPGGGLWTTQVDGNPPPESFTQPAPYLDPTVYCLTYTTAPLEEDLEITGPVTLYLHAAISIDDTNWMVDLVDVDPEGNRMLVTQGYLAAEQRALDEAKSLLYQPIHLKQDPVPVPPGEVIEYAITLYPTSNVFKEGHSMQLIIRNQDDLLSKLGIWGVYKLPFMQTVTHEIYWDSYLLLPVIPAE